ncbi:MAG TPA: hypothetical protein VJV03_00465 [Pyrinomonadaceae bacterium]|nr:hypothetical protein [Pyrinomonadaceae bacterium]
MKIKTVIVLLLVAGLLLAIGGFRDTFAPGFMNMSPQVKGSLDIAMQFAAAAIFLISAAAFYMSRERTRVKNG